MIQQPDTEKKPLDRWRTKALAVMLSEQNGILSPEAAAKKMLMPPLDWEEQKRLILEGLATEQWNYICNICGNALDERGLGLSYPDDPMGRLEAKPVEEAERHLCIRCGISLMSIFLAVQRDSK